MGSQLQSSSEMLSREQLLHLFDRFSFLTSQLDVKKRIADGVEDKQEAVAITTAIQEEIFLEMGIDPRFGISSLGKVNEKYENDQDMMIRFYKFIAREEMACDEAELGADEFAERMHSQEKLQEQQLEMLKHMRKFPLDDQSAILEKLRQQMENADFDGAASVLSSEQIQEIVRRRVSPLFKPSFWLLPFYTTTLHATKPNTASLDPVMSLMLQTPYFPLFTSLFLCVLVLFWKRFKARGLKSPPPGPWKLPAIGSLHHMVGPLPHHTLRDLAKKHGPIMHLKLGQLEAVIISSSKSAQEVLKTHELTFSQRPLVLAVQVMSFGQASIAFAPYGDFWRELRKICVFELLSAKHVQSFRSIREEEVGNLVESISSVSQ
ncbi:unnamed protein product [Prunus brigantina]